MPIKHANIAQLLNHASRLLSSLGDARLRPLGFRYAQVPVLALLRTGEKLTQAELTRQVGVEQSSMAQLLTRMESEGSIVRTPHPSHARMTEVAVSKETAKRLPAARTLLQKLDAEAVKGFSSDEVATLVRLLERVLANLRAA